MRRVFTVVAALAGLMVGPRIADASPFVIATFSGSGTSSGNNGILASASEVWLLNCSPLGPSDVPCPAGDFGWGSPGVGEGLVPYGESTPATDFEITFDVPLDPDQITVGSDSNCAGRETGGTTFCTDDGTLWTSSYNPSVPDSIAFFAPPGTSLAPGQEYFVNIFLDGSLPMSEPVDFTGEWTGGEAATPEPASLLLLGSGLALSARFLRKSRAKS
jgi:hypothetical protein